jgi:hypothetical protein
VFVDRRSELPNYCDYSPYIAQEDKVTVRNMDEAKIKDHFADLYVLDEENALVGATGYLVHTGDQVERVFLNNLRLSATSLAPGSNAPVPVDGTALTGGSIKETYRRSVRKITWCALCGSRVVQLVVVDDPRLPMTPAFICKDCYRSFRSDADGAFIEPEEHVAVYMFSEF